MFDGVRARNPGSGSSADGDRDTKHSKGRVMDSAILRRQPSGLPRRRRIGALPIVILAVLALVTALEFGSRQGLAAGVAAAGGVLLLQVLVLPVWFLGFGWSRQTIARIRDLNGLDRDDIPVRSTARFSAFPPEEQSIRNTYTRPWRTYQVMTLTDRGILLRTLPRSGESGGALLRFDRISSIEVGTASFGATTERAILVRGHEKGTPYFLGIVPVEEASSTLQPVSDEVYTSVLEQIIAGARATETDRRH